MYVSGGLTPKNISFIEGANSTFLKAYHDKGRVKTLLDTIPLFAVMVEDLGLRGAHVCAKQVTLFHFLCKHVDRLAYIEMRAQNSFIHHVLLCFASLMYLFDQTLFTFNCTCSGTQEHAKVTCIHDHLRYSTSVV
jgi:hypothetical protein